MQWKCIGLDIQNDGNEGCRNDAGAAEDQLNCLRSLRKNGHIRAHAVADAEGNRNDGQVARRHFFLGNELNTADNDRREHHNRCAAQNRLRHDKVKLQEIKLLLMIKIRK